MAQKSDTDDVGQPEHYYSYPAVSRDASLPITNTAGLDCYARLGLL